MSDLELAGRVAVVTGAGRNIGRAIALSLAAAGVAVVVNARSNLAEAEEVAGEIRNRGGTALVALADVVDIPAVERMVNAAVARFGRIDILVNNAALRGEVPLEEMSLEQWRKVTSVVLEGAFICTKSCLPHLKKSEGAAILNIGG
jgi:3-oxoacyl-[acyl-carrier protein] reductase